MVEWDCDTDYTSFQEAITGFPTREAAENFEQYKMGNTGTAPKIIENYRGNSGKIKTLNYMVNMYHNFNKMKHLPNAWTNRTVGKYGEF